MVATTPRPRQPINPPAVKKLDAVAESITQLRKLRVQAIKLDVKIAAATAVIKAALGESPEGTVAGVPAVRWATTARTQLDTKAIREKHPDVAAACVKVVTVRTFQLIDPAK